jgi:Na+-translocating ferredoxin:NAD+ oxidoreductase subunit B
MNQNPYQKLAQRLNALPNGFPPTTDGAELRLLAKLYTPEEAALAADLRITLETTPQIAARLEQAGTQPLDIRLLQDQLKSMARKGLINAGRSENGLGFGLMPFVVGIYEAQIGRMDAELATLFEEYYRQAFGQMLAVQPSFHRVIPVGESIPIDLGIEPYESARQIVENAQAWGVLDCICRVQKALIGQACEHPVDVCMAFGQKPGVFDHHPVVRALTREQALETLQRAAAAGLVHSVSNVRQEISYICNCCTCACGILRGVSELGLANVVARSGFVNQAEETLCIGCETCIPACQFGALSLQDFVVQVDRGRCVGCGVCVTHCDTGALHLVRRPPAELVAVPEAEMDWKVQRAQARGIDIHEVL